MIEHHVAVTGSELGTRLIRDWDNALQRFVKVLPIDYKRAIEAMKEVEAMGMTGEEAVMAAFQKNVHDPARVSGN
jgi:glutamate synthase (ferredoxin)